MNTLFKYLMLTLTIFFSSQLMAGEVSRAQFTTQVVDREPVDMVVTLSTDQSQVSYFTELTDLSGTAITHQWLYFDEIMFEKTFQVGGPRWRVWSSKTLQPGWTGRWTVNTLDEERNLLLTQVFEYQ